MNYYKYIWNGSERSRRKSLTIHVRLIFYMWKTFFSKSIIFKVERNVLITKKDGSETEVQVIRWNNYMIEKIQKILVLLRGPSVKNNLSHTGHCVVADQGWEELRLERGGLALHSYRFYFWFECVSKGVASPIMHRNRRCPSLLFSWLLSWKQRAYVPESQSSSS